MTTTVARRIPRLALRLLLLNLPLLLLPAAGFLVVGDLESRLRAAQAEAVTEQARVLAAALGESGEVLPETARLVLRQLDADDLARLRILDRRGRLLADSAPAAPTESPDPALQGPEIRAALAGDERGGLIQSRPEDAPAALAAVPIRSGGQPVGAVLATQSTRRITAEIGELRRAILLVFLAAALLAAALTLGLAGRIVRPLAALQRETAHLLDRRGVASAFPGSERTDEIGDLARALEELRRRLDEQLHRAEAVAADVSHEFKNPLAAIRGASEMLAEVEAPAERRRFHAIVGGEIARLERLLAGMRDMARLEARLEHEARAPVAVAAVVESVVERYVGRGAPIALAVPASAREARALAAPDRLAQVVENLLDNARGFAPPGTAIEVAVDAQPGAVTVVVRDHGPGIPAGHLDRVFDRFFSYRPGNARGAGHSGLGLAIAKGIVTAYGGTIVAANAPGGGATFTVSLPQAAPGQLALLRD